MSGGRHRQSIKDLAGSFNARVLGWQHQFGITVVPISAAEDTADQLRHLIGAGRPQARGRV
jgi:hypothetical protein